MKLTRFCLIAIGVAATLGFISELSSLATAQDTPKAVKRDEPAGPPKGPPERRDNPNVPGPRFTPPVEGDAPRRGPDGPDGERFRPGRPVADLNNPNPNPGQGPRRNPGDPNPNPNDFDGRRPAVPVGPNFNGRRGPGPNDFEQLKETDPEMFELMQADMKLDQQTRDEADEYRRAKPSERDAIKTKLAKSVQDHYDVRQKRRELELRRLEEQLTRLRDSVKKRVDEKDAMIKQRVSQLIGNPDDGF